MGTKKPYSVEKAAEGIAKLLKIRNEDKRGGHINLNFVMAIGGVPKKYRGDVKEYIYLNHPYGMRISLGDIDIGESDWLYPPKEFPWADYSAELDNWQRLIAQGRRSEW